MFCDFITKYTEFFCLKNEKSFCIAKAFCNANASHIFSTKNIGIFEILTFENLTTSLVLNNWALTSAEVILKHYHP